MNKTIKMGEIIPRDYGITIKANNGNKVFLSPVKYALARVMIETPEEISQRIQVLSNIHKVKKGALEKELKVGIRKKKNNTSSFLSGAALKKVQKYANRYVAEVKSNSTDKTYETVLEFYSPKLEHIANHSHICDCKDSLWSNVKSASIVCIHNAALQIGLYLDEKYNVSTNESHTHLFPRDRRSHTLAFNIAKMYTRGVSFEDEIVNAILFGYFIEDKSYYTLSREALLNPQIYTRELTQILSQEKQIAKYEVFRQEEKENQINSMTETERRIRASSNLLEEKIKDMLLEREYMFDGYSLEFQNTPEEMIGYRFVSKNNSGSIYTIAITKENLPIIIRKNLLSKTIENEHQIITNPYLSSNERYFSLDDATKKEALTKIIIPGENETSTIEIPQILKERYYKLRK